MENKTPKIISFFFPTIGNILWVVIFFGVLAYGGRMMNADGDLALHLNLGQYILNTGRIPLSDIFSHTMSGQPVMQHAWLSTVVFALVMHTFGFEGLILLCAVVIATTYTLLFKYSSHKSGTLLAAFFTTVLAIGASIMHWLIRPHIITYLMLACWMIVLNHLHQGKIKQWWILPVMMLVWVNLHGGFIAGFMSWFVYGFGVIWDENITNKNSGGHQLHQNFWRNYLFGGLSAFFVSLINPSGIGLWKRIITHLGNKFLADVTIEFQSPNFHETTFWPFLIFIGLLFVVIGLSKNRPETPMLFNAGAWMLMGLYSVRNIPLYAIVAAPFLAVGLANLVSDFANQSKVANRFLALDHRIQIMDRKLKGYFWPAISILIAIIALATGRNLSLGGQKYAFDPKVFPVEAVNWLEDNPQEGEMFNYFDWGGYLEYRLWPEKRVFIDSKSDFFGEAFVRQYLRVMNTRDDWQDILENYNVSWAILPIDKPAVNSIHSKLGWEVIYKDETAVILSKE